MLLKDKQTSGGLIICDIVSSIGLTETTYTFETDKEKLYIHNIGGGTITATVNGTDHTINEFDEYIETIGDGQPSITTVSLTGSRETVAFKLTGISIETGADIDLSFIDSTGNVIVSSGMVELPTYNYNNDGTINLSSCKARLYPNSDFTGRLAEFDIDATVITLTENVTNYIVADVNNGAPILRATLDVNEVTTSDVLPVFTCSYIGNEASGFSIMDWGKSAIGTQNVLSLKDIKTHRFQVESGLQLSVDASGYVTTSPGAVWHGITRTSFPETTTETDQCFLRTCTALDTWSRVAVTSYPTDSYDMYDGTGAQPLTTNYWGVIWVYKDMGTEARTHFIRGNVNSIDKQSALAASTPNELEAIMYNEALLIGRIVFQNNSAYNTHSIEGAFEKMFMPSLVNDHNSLTGLQPTNNGQYYHSDQPINTTDEVEFLTVNSTLTNGTDNIVDHTTNGAALKSPGTGVYEMHVGSTAYIQDTANVINRAEINTTHSRLNSPDGTHYIESTDSGGNIRGEVLTSGTATVDRLGHTTLRTYAASPDGDNKLEVKNNEVVLTVGDGKISAHETTGIELKPSIATDPSQLILGTDKSLNFNDGTANGANRLEITATNTRLKAPTHTTKFSFQSGTTYAGVQTTGGQWGYYTADNMTKSMFWAAVDNTSTIQQDTNGVDISRNSQSRIKVDDTETELASPNGSRTINLKNDVCWLSCSMYPGWDQGSALGNSSYRYAAVYSASGVITTSDKRVKTNIKELTDIEIKAFSKLRPVSYDRIDIESNDRHVGFIAQEVEATFVEYGLDAKTYGFMDYSVKDPNAENKGSLYEKYNMNDMYSLSYEQFTALQLAYSQSLEKRLKAIEEHLGL